MAYDNSLNSNDQPYNSRKTLASIHFDDLSKKSPEQDWQHKSTKRRQNTLTQEEYTNAAAWKIDNLERVLAEIEQDSKRVLSMILDIRNIYTKYLDQANKADKERYEIYTFALRLEQELYINNEEREEAVSLL